MSANGSPALESTSFLSTLSMMGKAAGQGEFGRTVIIQILEAATPRVAVRLGGPGCAWRVLDVPMENATFVSRGEGGQDPLRSTELAFAPADAVTVASGNGDAEAVEADAADGEPRDDAKMDTMADGVVTFDVLRETAPKEPVRLSAPAPAAEGEAPADFFVNLRWTTNAYLSPTDVPLQGLGDSTRKGSNTAAETALPAPDTAPGTPPPEDGTGTEGGEDTESADLFFHTPPREGRPEAEATSLEATPQGAGGGSDGEDVADVDPPNTIATPAPAAAVGGDAADDEAAAEEAVEQPVEEDPTPATDDAAAAEQPPEDGAAAPPAVEEVEEPDTKEDDAAPEAEAAVPPAPQSDNEDHLGEASALDAEGAEDGEPDEPPQRPNGCHNEEHLGQSGKQCSCVLPNLVPGALSSTGAVPPTEKGAAQQAIKGADQSATTDNGSSPRPSSTHSARRVRPPSQRRSAHYLMDVTPDNDAPTRLGGGEESSSPLAVHGGAPPAPPGDTIAASARQMSEKSAEEDEEELARRKREHEESWRRAFTPRVPSPTHKSAPAAEPEGPARPYSAVPPQAVSPTVIANARRHLHFAGSGGERGAAPAPPPAPAVVVVPSAENLFQGVDPDAAVAFVEVTSVHSTAAADPGRLVVAAFTVAGGAPAFATALMSRAKAALVPHLSEPILFPADASVVCELREAVAGIGPAAAATADAADMSGTTALWRTEADVAAAGESPEPRVVVFRGGTDEITTRWHFTTVRAYRERVLNMRGAISSAVAAGTASAGACQLQVIAEDASAGSLWVSAPQRSAASAAEASHGTSPQPGQFFFHHTLAAQRGPTPAALCPIATFPVHNVFHVISLVPPPEADGAPAPPAVVSSLVAFDAPGVWQRATPESGEKTCAVFYRYVTEDPSHVSTLPPHWAPSSRSSPKPAPRTSSNLCELRMTMHDVPVPHADRPPRTRTPTPPAGDRRPVSASSARGRFGRTPINGTSGLSTASSGAGAKFYRVVVTDDTDANPRIIAVSRPFASRAVAGPAGSSAAAAVAAPILTSQSFFFADAASKKKSAAAQEPQRWRFCLLPFVSYEKARDAALGGALSQMIAGNKPAVMASSCIVQLASLLRARTAELRVAFRDAAVSAEALRDAALEPPALAEVRVALESRRCHADTAEAVVFKVQSIVAQHAPTSLEHAESVHGVAPPPSIAHVWFAPSIFSSADVRDAYSRSRDEGKEDPSGAPESPREWALDRRAIPESSPTVRVAWRGGGGAAASGAAAAADTDTITLFTSAERLRLCVALVPDPAVPSPAQAASTLTPSHTPRDGRALFDASGLSSAPSAVGGGRSVLHPGAGAPDTCGPHSLLPLPLLQRKIRHLRRQAWKRAGADDWPAAVLAGDETVAMRVDNYVEVDLTPSVFSACDEADSGRLFESTVVGQVRVSHAVVLEIRGAWLKVPAAGSVSVPTQYTPSCRLWAMRGSFVRRSGLVEAVEVEHAFGQEKKAIGPSSVVEPSTCDLVVQTYPIDYADPTPEQLADALPGVPTDNFQRLPPQPHNIPFPKNGAAYTHMQDLSGMTSVLSAAPPAASSPFEGRLITVDVAASADAAEDRADTTGAAAATQQCITDVAFLTTVLQQPDVNASSRKTSRVVFVFGDAYTTRTGATVYAAELEQVHSHCLQVRAEPVTPVTIMDSLQTDGFSIGRGTCILDDSKFLGVSHKRFAPVLEWFHGGLGVAADDEAERRDAGARAWRSSLREADLGAHRRPRGTYSVTAIQRQPPSSHLFVFAPTLTRCGTLGCLLFGGFSDNRGLQMRASVFLDEEQEWAPFRVVPSPLSDGTPLPAPRHGHTTVFRETDESVYVYGGNANTADGRSGAVALLDDVWAIRLADGEAHALRCKTAKDVERPALARWRHASLLHDDRMIVIGGQHSPSPRRSSSSGGGAGSKLEVAPCNPLLVLDVRTAEWQMREAFGRDGVVPKPRHGHSAASVAQNSVAYIYGGRDGDDQLLGDLHQLDLLTHMWTAVEPNGAVRPPPTELASMAASHVGGTACLFLVGGLSDAAQQDPNTSSAADSDGLSVFLFSTATHFWRRVSFKCGPAPQRFGAAVVPLPVGDEWSYAAEQHRRRKGLPEPTDLPPTHLLLVGGTVTGTDGTEDLMNGGDDGAEASPCVLVLSTRAAIAPPAASRPPGRHPRQLTVPGRAASLQTSSGQASPRGGSRKSRQPRNKAHRPPALSPAATNRRGSKSMPPPRPSPTQNTRGGRPRRRVDDGQYDVLLSPRSRRRPMSSSDVGRSAQRLSAPSPRGASATSPSSRPHGPLRRTASQGPARVPEVKSAFSTLSRSEVRSQIDRLYYQDLERRQTNLDVLAQRVDRERYGYPKPARSPVRAARPRREAQALDSTPPTHQSYQTHPYARPVTPESIQRDDTDSDATTTTTSASATPRQRRASPTESRTSSATSSAASSAKRVAAVAPAVEEDSYAASSVHADSAASVDDAPAPAQVQSSRASEKSSSSSSYKSRRHSSSHASSASYRDADAHKADSAPRSPVAAEDEPHKSADIGAVSYKSSSATSSRRASSASAASHAAASSAAEAAAPPAAATPASTRSRSAASVTSSKEEEEVAVLHDDSSIAPTPPVAVAVATPDRHSEASEASEARDPYQDDDFESDSPDSSVKHEVAVDGPSSMASAPAAAESIPASHHSDGELERVEESSQKEAPSAHAVEEEAAAPSPSQSEAAIESRDPYQDDDFESDSPYSSVKHEAVDDAPSAMASVPAVDESIPANQPQEVDDEKEEEEEHRHELPGVQSEEHDISKLTPVQLVQEPVGSQPSHSLGESDLPHSTPEVREDVSVPQQEASSQSARSSPAREAADSVPATPRSRSPSEAPAQPQSEEAASHLEQPSHASSHHDEKDHSAEVVESEKERDAVADSEKAPSSQGEVDYYADSAWEVDDEQPAALRVERAPSSEREPEEEIQESWNDAGADASRSQPAEDSKPISEYDDVQDDENPPEAAAPKAASSQGEVDYYADSAWEVDDEQPAALRVERAPSSEREPEDVADDSWEHSNANASRSQPIEASQPATAYDDEDEKPSSPDVPPAASSQVVPEEAIEESMEEVGADASRSQPVEPSQPVSDYGEVDEVPAEPKAASSQGDVDYYADSAWEDDEEPPAAAEVARAVLEEEEELRDEAGSSWENVKADASRSQPIEASQPITADDDEEEKPAAAAVPQVASSQDEPEEAIGESWNDAGADDSRPRFVEASQPISDHVEDDEEPAAAPEVPKAASSQGDADYNNDSAWEDDDEPPAPLRPAVAPSSEGEPKDEADSSWEDIEADDSRSQPIEAAAPAVVHSEEEVGERPSAMATTDHSDEEHDAAPSAAVVASVPEETPSEREVPEPLAASYQDDFSADERDDSEPSRDLGQEHPAVEDNEEEYPASEPEVNDPSAAEPEEEGHSWRELGDEQPVAVAESEEHHESPRAPEKEEFSSREPSQEHPMEHSEDDAPAAQPEEQEQSWRELDDDKSAASVSDAEPVPVAEPEAKEESLHELGDDHAPAEESREEEDHHHSIEVEEEEHSAAKSQEEEHQSWRELDDEQPAAVATDEESHPAAEPEEEQSWRELSEEGGAPVEPEDNQEQSWRELDDDKQSAVADASEEEDRRADAEPEEDTPSREASQKHPVEESAATPEPEEEEHQSWRELGDEQPAAPVSDDESNPAPAPEEDIPSRSPSEEHPVDGNEESGTPAAEPEEQSWRELSEEGGAPVEPEENEEPSWRELDDDQHAAAAAPEEDIPSREPSQEHLVDENAESGAPAAAEPEEEQQHQPWRELSEERAAPADNEENEDPSWRELDDDDEQPADADASEKERRPAESEPEEDIPSRELSQEHPVAAEPEEEADKSWRELGDDEIPAHNHEEAGSTLDHEEEEDPSIAVPEDDVTPDAIVEQPRTDEEERPTKVTSAAESEKEQSWREIGDEQPAAIASDEESHPAAEPEEEQSWRELSEEGGAPVEPEDNQEQSWRELDDDKHADADVNEEEDRPADAEPGEDTPSREPSQEHPVEESAATPEPEEEEHQSWRELGDEQPAAPVSDDESHPAPAPEEDIPSREPSEEHSVDGNEESGAPAAEPEVEQSWRELDDDKQSAVADASEEEAAAAAAAEPAEEERQSWRELSEEKSAAPVSDDESHPVAAEPEEDGEQSWRELGDEEPAARADKDEAGPAPEEDDAHAADTTAEVRQWRELSEESDVPKDSPPLEREASREHETTGEMRKYSSASSEVVSSAAAAEAASHKEESVRSAPAAEEKERSGAEASSWRELGDTESDVAGEPEAAARDLLDRKQGVDEAIDDDDFDF